MKKCKVLAFLLSLGLGFSLSVSRASAIGTPIQRVFVVVFENTNAQNSLNQSFMKSLLSRGAYLSNFHGVTHPSQGNYMAMAAGDLMGVRDDRNYNIDGTHLGDLLESKGLNWKVYAEDYPEGSCFTGGGRATYVRKHNPYMSFNNIQNNPARCAAHIVSANRLSQDVASGQLPDYSLFVPGLKSDGHDTGVAFADRWLQQTFGALINDPKFMQGTLFVVTFDENDSHNDRDQNLIYTVLLGDSVLPGSQTNARYDHYSLLRTIEDLFSLGTLGRKDQSANPITEVWR